MKECKSTEQPYQPSQAFYQRREELKKEILQVVEECELVWQPVLRTWWSDEVGPHSWQERAVLGIKQQCRGEIENLESWCRSGGMERLFTGEYTNPYTGALNPVRFAEEFLFCARWPVWVGDLGLEECVDQIVAKHFSAEQFRAAYFRTYMRYFQGHFPKPLTRSEFLRADRLLAEMKLEGDERWAFVNRYVLYECTNQRLQASKAMGMNSEQFTLLQHSLHEKIMRTLAQKRNITELMSLVSFVSEAAGNRNESNGLEHWVNHERAAAQEKLAEYETTLAAMKSFTEFVTWYATDQNASIEEMMGQHAEDFGEHLIVWFAKKAKTSKRKLWEKFKKHQDEMAKKKPVTPAQPDLGNPS